MYNAKRLKFKRAEKNLILRRMNEIQTSLVMHGTYI